MPDTNIDMMPYMLTGVTGVVGALCTVIVALFRLNQAATKREVETLSQQVQSLTTRADDCERDRIELHKENADLKIRLLSLESDR